MKASIKRLKSLQKKVVFFSLVLAIIVSFSVGLVFGYKAYFADHVYFQTSFSQFNMGGKSKAEVQDIVNSAVEHYARSKITIIIDGQLQDFTVSDLGVSFDVSATVDDVINSGKNDGKVLSVFNNRNVYARYRVDSAVFSKALADFFAKYETGAVNANLQFSGKTVIAIPSVKGRIVDRGELVNKIAHNFRNLENKSVELALIDNNPVIRDTDIERAKLQAQALVKSQFTLYWGYDKWPVTGKNLFEFLAFYPEGQNKNSLLDVPHGSEQFSIIRAGIGSTADKPLAVGLQDDKIDAFLASIAQVVDKSAKDATLRFENGRVVEFSSAQDGQELNREETKKILVQKLNSISESGDLTATVELVVKITKAKIANREVNSLGIKELIGSGVSYFAGSIANRVHNIALGASLINGTLVAPGEVFSFTKLVGPVSADQGFKQAYVIQSGRTVLDDGGGICQVSTTVFRAALNTGLPIVKRTAHAYRVSYYEQRGFKAGFDATIFSPSVDLQFKNDTENHILVQTTVDRINSRIQVDIYGTRDGRRVELSDPVVGNITPAPEAKYQDDPSLKKGVVKQVDFAANGATSIFSRKVYRGGELIINETFKSVYRPWQAVFLVGTAT